MPKTKTASSIASSSRVAASITSSDHEHTLALTADKGRSVASRGTNSTNTNHNTVCQGGGSGKIMSEQKYQSKTGGGGGTASGAATSSDGSYIHSTPQMMMWNTTPERMKSRRELEQKIRNRSESRNTNYRTMKTRNHLPPNLSSDQSEDDDNDDGDNRRQNSNKATLNNMDGGPVPKILRDFLLQTAMFGIDTTAKLSKPTLDITKNMLLPQIIIPLFLEVWENYVPARIQTWLKVIPTSLKNLANLLCDTQAGKASATKAGQLSEDALDVASSEVARQFWIDATVALIKFFEALHTPEVKAMLDQLAVGACRLVDVLSSGKAKEVWFDVSESLWALIEVLSDEVMVLSLAEGCAQICFALENERESLKQRRWKDNQTQKDFASQRRRERDQRQMETYPPGKAVVRDGLGRDGFGEALMDSLGRYRLDEFEEQMYDGPPQRVIVTTNSTEYVEGCPSNEPGSTFSPTMKKSDIHANVRSDDSESEITTEIEDLHCGEEPVGHGDVNKKIYENLNLTRCNNALSYERDEHGDYDAILQERIDQLHWQTNDKGAATEMDDAFDEPILQFYRKLNEVLVETRKHGRNTLGSGTQKKKPTMQHEEEDGDGKAQSKHVDPSPSTPLQPSTGVFRFRKWKLIIIASLLCAATTCVVWFALGCFGLYILVSDGGLSHQLSLFPNNIQHPSNIVIQIMSSENQGYTNECDATRGNGIRSQQNKKVASITLEEWNEMKLGVEKAIGTR